MLKPGKLMWNAFLAPWAASTAVWLETTASVFAQLELDREPIVSSQFDTFDALPAEAKTRV